MVVIVIGFVYVREYMFDFYEFGRKLLFYFNCGKVLFVIFENNMFRCIIKVGLLEESF